MIAHGTTSDTTNDSCEKMKAFLMRLHAAECLKNCGYMSSRTGRLRWYVRIGAPLLDSHEGTA